MCFPGSPQTSHIADQKVYRSLSAITHEVIEGFEVKDYRYASCPWSRTAQGVALLPQGVLFWITLSCQSLEQSDTLGRPLPPFPKLRPVRIKAVRPV